MGLQKGRKLFNLGTMRVVLIIGWLSLWSLGLHAQPSAAEYVVKVISPSDTITRMVVSDPLMYQQRWDTLAQPRFWRRVMSLPPDSAVLNIAETRQILDVFPAAQYEAMNSAEKRAFKLAKLRELGLPAHTRLYVTYGKSDYYQIRAVMPHIHESIEVFTEQGTDPWYAQAILLIESPGQLRQSYVGAYGPFQLMPYVAREQGLVVSSQRDDRADVRRSAYAAARYLQQTCIPHTRRMLQRQGIDYQEDELWFRLMVLHCYHAGAGNVAGVVRKINPRQGGMALIQELWQTRYGGFGNASQNYSQVALASLLELDALIAKECKIVCAADKRTTHPIEPIEPMSAYEVMRE